METMTKNELLNRLYGVYHKATEITTVLGQQTDVATQYRHDQYSEVDKVDQSFLDKSKFIFATLYIAYVMMRLVLGLVFYGPGTVISIISWNIVFFIILFGRFRNKHSKIMTVIQVIFMVCLSLDILSYFWIAIQDLMRGIIWSSILSIAVFGVSIFVIRSLIRYLNHKVDLKNLQIRKHNTELQESNQKLTQQYAQLTNRLNQLRAEMEVLISGWYQVDDYFYTLNGIQSLIRVLENQEADTLKEAIKTVREQDHRQQMLNYQQSILEANQQMIINQKAIKSQLQYANVMSTMGVALQFQHNMQQDKTNRLLDEQNQHLYKIRRHR